MIFFGDGNRARMSKEKDAVRVVRKVAEQSKEVNSKHNDITDRDTK